ncbi:MAG: fibronectin type III domain-containing protein, partial [Elusimicrobia bacterium]|nr:fibronectin type III domain-containing protein [Elusimicrobiota bacterium]
YVRPGSGTYGNNTGTSYANAWDGFASVVWGGTGINAGDALYVCGTHIYATDFSPSQNQNAVKISGVEGKPITIRGDYPEDPGVIIGSRKILASSFAPMANGSSYSLSSWSWLSTYGWQGDPTASPRLLRTVTSAAEVAATEGSMWHDATAKILYVNPYGDTIDDIYTNMDFSLNIDGHDYINVENLKLFGGANRVLQLCNTTSASGADHVIINNCEIAFSYYTGILAFGYSTSDITISNTIIHDVPTGTYAVGYTHNNWIMRNVEVYSGGDIDNKYSNATKSDRHALGGQNLSNLLIEHCYVHDWAGDGVIDYVTGGAMMNDVTIRYNRFINLIDTPNQNYHYGIAKHGNNFTAFENNTKNWKIYNNIFNNLSQNAVKDTSSGAAIRIKGGAADDGNKPFIANNVFYNVAMGIYSAPTTYQSIAGFTAKNNIFLSPKLGGYHIFQSYFTGTNAVDIDNNLYYPDTSGSDNKWAWKSQNQANFVAWKTASSQDANSILADPLLLNANGNFSQPDDFKLMPGSPAINAGTNLGSPYNLDFEGNTRGQDGAWDIGAYEHVDEIGSSYMQYKLWQVEGTDDATLTRYKNAGVDAIQNSSPGNISGNNFSINVPIWAEAAARNGLEYHAYVKSGDGSADTVSPQQMAALTNWPANLKAIMFDSERAYVGDSVYAEYKKVIPANVKMIAPEGPWIDDPAIYPYREIGQTWFRVSGWGNAQIVRVTNIPASYYIAEAQGTPLYSGAQMYSTYSSANELPVNLRTSVYLLAQASFRMADGVHWGVTHITDYTPLQVLGDAYKQVNALDLTNAQPVVPKVAVLMDKNTNLGWTQMQFFWEMVIRANIQFKVIFASDLNSATLSKYSALVTPVLNNTTLALFTADQRSALQSFASSKPILTSCGDVNNNNLPAWVIPLLSSRYNRVPFEWYPSFQLGLNEVNEGGPFLDSMYALVADYRTKTGIKPCNQTPYIISKEFIKNGISYLWNVDTVNGTMEIVEKSVYDNPPQITNISASSVTQTGAIVTWSTDKVSTSQIDYGTTTSYGASTTLDSNLVTSHSVNLSGLTASTLYHYRVKSKDAANKEAVSADYTFTTTSPPSYTLTVTSGTGGSVGKNPDQASYLSGTSVTLTATASAGYTFSSWSGDLTGSTNPATVTMNANKNITANFSALSYTLTINPATGGVVTKNPDKASYSYGEQVTLTATANAGYTFFGWSGNLSGTANPVTLTMDANKNITPIFNQLQYSLTLNATNGSVAKSPDKTTYTYGEVVTLTATANAGYIFESWSGDLTGSTNPATITINGNKTVTASFAALQPYAGDSILKLEGNTGYASLANASVADLDYTKDFAIEAISKIQPHTTGTRHDSFVQKGPNYTIWNAASAGFAIGITEGQYENFGKKIQAKVGDGTNQAVVTSGYYEGYVYAIMTWEVASKTLKLYINGNEIGNNVNAAINPTSIKNTSDLLIGKGEGPLKRDIFMARLWNRLLSSAEVTALWSNYSGTGRHALPAGFSTTLLQSEWLMHETCATDGSQGTTHIKDSMGRNHLALVGEAKLYKGNGQLAMAYPANGETGVNKAVTLRVTGGISALTGSITLPLHYYFQVDETSSFNSSNLKESGWLVHYGQWQPILKPNTIYYWRVKVRDSSDTPFESSFTASRSFTTEGPTDWYVRPPAAIGTYGKEDGASYANAWNSIKNIVWGENGVEAGDNLYLCGVHVYEEKVNYYVGTAPLEYIKVSGLSNEYPITIRMDYSSDPGTIIGAGLYNLPSVVWEGPDTNGVYWTNDLRYGGQVEFTGTNYVWLDKENVPTWTGHNGAVYNVANATSPWLTDFTYVKTTDGSNPTGKILTSGHGYKFDLGRSSYIKFYKCKFYGSDIGKEIMTSTTTAAPPPHHITYDGCELAYGGTLISLSAGHNDWTIRNCDLHDAGNGIYTYTPGNMYRLLVEYNTIHDISTPKFYHKDGHAVGVQNGIGFIIQNNKMWNTGEAICFWSGNYEMKDNTVRYNFIKDVNVRQTGGNGITVSGNNDAATFGKRTGFKIYSNIIMNTGIGATEDWQGYGISSNNKDYMEIYNNVFYKTLRGMRFAPQTSTGPVPVQATVYNNMFISPQSTDTRAYASVGGSANPTNLFWDYNLYYPITSASFSVAGIAHDQHSVFADPLFTSTDPNKTEDFKLQSGSLAINKGKDVGLTEDFIGTAIPQGSAPDIGAYEFTGPFDTTPPTISSVASTSITQTSATVTWTTNEAATSQVEYGTSISYGLSTALDSSLVTAHSVALSSLSAGTLYHYRVKSKDASSNEAVSGDYTFTTVSPPPPSYTLSVTSGTGGSVGKNPNQASYLSGTSVTLTATASAGYTFSSWSGDLTGSTNPATVIMNANKSITANFTANTYTLTINPATGGTVTKNPNKTSYSYVETVTLTATANSGYSFSSWSGDLSGSVNPATVTINGNKMVTANFTQNPAQQYTLTIITANGRVDKNPNQATYASGSSVILTAIPNTGYAFTNWSGDLKGKTNPNSITMNANKSVTAKFTKSRCRLNLSAENGRVQMEPAPEDVDLPAYEYETQVRLTAYPDPGYLFSHWEGDLDSEDNPIDITMDKEKNIKAIFTKQPITIKVTVSPKELKGSAPFTVTFKAQATGAGSKIISYQWDFEGKGNYQWYAAGVQEVEYTYLAAGNYTPTVKVTNALGEVETYALLVQVTPHPLAPRVEVEADAQKGKAPLTVSFKVKASSESGIAKYEWDFEGDGIYEYRAQDTADTTSIYTQGGTYEANLRVTDFNGLATVKTIIIDVEDNLEAPEINLKIKNKETGANFSSPAQVNFAVESRQDSLLYYLWDFEGDGVYEYANYKANTASYTYRIPGKYQPQVKVVSKKNLSARATVDLVVEDKNPLTAPAPIATFKASPEQGELPLKVNFINTTKDALLYTLWDFDGDGIYEKRVKDNLPVTFIYQDPGTYFAKAYAVGKNKSGNEAKADIATLKIVVTAKNKSVIITDPDDGEIIKDKVTIAARIDPRIKPVLISFQYKMEKTNEWVTLAGNPPTSTRASWDVSSLANGQYKIRIIVMAREEDYLSDEMAVKVDNLSVDAGSRELANLKRKLIDPEERSSSLLCDGTQVEVPLATLDEETVLDIKRLEKEDVRHPIDLESVKDLGIYREINPERSKTSKITKDVKKQFDKAITVEIPFEDKDNDGVVDGTKIKKETLKIYTYVEEAKEWQALFDCRVDTENNLVEGKVNHCSLFGLGGLAEVIAPAIAGGAAAAGGGGGGCFIATCVYGQDSSEVNTLRKFRDTYLLTNSLGQAFVNFYYKHSPGWVASMQNKTVIKKIVRLALRPAVWFAKLINAGKRK